jgi:excisionase family DNA binding protein
MTVKGAADQLAVSTKSIRRWIARGELAAHQVGRLIRISEAALLLYLQQHPKRID